MSTFDCKFPSSFPMNCPPSKAVSKETMVYRLIEGDVPTEKDFKSYAELGKAFKPNKKYPYIEYGLSVNTDYNELYNNYLSSIYLKKQFKKIAGGKTFDSTGVIQYTPCENNVSHVTWWLYEGIKPHGYFKVVGGD